MSRVQGHTEKAPAPAGPYSQSARVGSFVAVAGQAGYDPATRRFVGEDIESQTHQALTNLEAALKASGASMDDVVRVGVFLTETNDFPAMNEAYRQAFSEPFPARTTVYVSLPDGMKVEMDALAIIVS